MKIIEDYVDLENKVSKPEKHNDYEEQGQSELKTSSKLQTSEPFDCNEYYKNQCFDLKNEIGKERAIKEFFKQKYRIESDELAEENLRNFLEDRTSPLSKQVSPFTSNEPITKDALGGSDVNMLVRISEEVDAHTRAGVEADGDVGRGDKGGGGEGNGG